MPTQPTEPTEPGSAPDGPPDGLPGYLPGSGADPSPARRSTRQKAEQALIDALLDLGIEPGTATDVVYALTTAHLETGHHELAQILAAIDLPAATDLTNLRAAFTGQAPTAPAAPPDDWTPQYEEWRHGGWYVTNIHHPSGAVGCVSRNYPDGRWRIVCDPREGSYRGGPNDHTYPTRDAAARAEHALAAAVCEEGNQ